VTDADGGTLSYYASQADAMAASNALASSTVSAPNGTTTTYWVRSATNGGCYGVASVAVTVTDNPDVTTAPTTVCENAATGAASVNLSSLVTDADGGTLSYYASQAHANAGTNALASSTVNAPNGTTTTYWVRSATSGGCYSVASVAVTVTDNPDVTATSTTVCEAGSTGEASIDLASLVTTPDGGTLSYYASQAHAEAASNALASSTVSAPLGTTTYWVRSATSGGCYGVASIAVTVTDNPDVTTAPTTVCETGATGHASVNLSSLVTTADGGTLSYYTNQTDAMNATNALASSTVSAPNGASTYWVRSATSGGCYGVASVVFTVTDNPDVITASTTVCEDINTNTPRTGGASVNLASLVSQADGGTLSYYASQANAMAASNAFASSTVFAPLGTTTYWVRSATSGGCYGVASVAVTVNICSGITLEKRTNGVVDNTKTYTFAIYSGSMRNTKPGSATALHTQSTTLANSTSLFDGILLSANQKYSLCELDIPSGYSVIWEVVDANGTATSVSTLYDPDVTSGGGDYNQGEAVGNLCTEFGAGTALELPTNEDGQTIVRLRFRVNNTFPLGTARTPGYWKNWNMCTGGKQAQTAVKNGGKAAGFYLLEDHLPLTLWANSTSGVICSRFSNFVLTSCAPAVKLLNTQDASGKQKASDAAYNLAKHLLAYKLNIASKAAPCASAAAAATNAEALLSEICFNGSGDYLPSNTKLTAKRALALSYAKTLDAFNNNLPCAPIAARTLAASSSVVDGQFEAEASSFMTSVYPNPTHSDATITFSAPKAGHAVLTVYNALGAKVATLYDGQVQTGEVKALALQGANLATGTYFYRVSINGITKTNRFNIIK
jgi:hypothetical protein